MFSYNNWDRIKKSLALFQHDAFYMFREISTNRDILKMLMSREAKARTAGTIFGYAWLFLVPGTQVFIYWFLLSYLLKMRMPGNESFIEYFLTGIIPWLLIADLLLRSLNLLNEYSVIYKKSSFPISILPLVPVLFSGTIYIVIYTLTILFLFGMAKALVAPILLVFLIYWIVPLCILFSIIGIFLPDIREIIRVMITLSMYLTPILYSPEIVPKSLSFLLILNPFADWMAIFHGILQGHDFSLASIIRLLMFWLVIILPVGWLFRRSLPMIREMV